MRTIYFLGDDSNRRFVPEGVLYFAMDQFRRGQLWENFRKVFIPLAGRTHHFTKEGGVEVWLKFVFERWFIIREFLHTQNIVSFWIFDSDTLIAADLAAREDRFSNFDTTEQCRGCCLNGWISSRSIVDGYCEKMVELYKRPDYLAAHRVRLETQTGLAFNEMDAWQTYREEAGVKTFAIGTPYQGEVFDDALAFTAGWQVSATRPRRQTPVKRIVSDRRGGFFGFSENHAEPVRFVTLNLSWMPDYLFRRLARNCLPLAQLAYDASQCSEVDFHEPGREKFLRGFSEKLWKVRQFVQRICGQQA